MDLPEGSYNGNYPPENVLDRVGDSKNSDEHLLAGVLTIRSSPSVWYSVVW